MLKYIKCEVRLSELNTIHKSVAAWEYPVLEAVQANSPKGGEITIIGETLVNRPEPDAAGEFQRLSNLYGQAASQGGAAGLPYVATVYGQFGVGQAALARAIAAAVVEDPAASLLGDDSEAQISSVGG
jgi:hypothetical protein